MKHRVSFSHRMDASDRHIWQRDERTGGGRNVSVRSFQTPSKRRTDGQSVCLRLSLILGN